MSCTYTIVSQRSTTVPNPAGGFMDAMEVRFTTEEGVPDRVVIPKAQFTAENVDALIQKQCATITAVANLGK